jgi:hypothetical protein
MPFSRAEKDLEKREEFQAPDGRTENSPGLNGTKLRRMWAIYFVLASPQNPVNFHVLFPS